MLKEWRGGCCKIKSLMFIVVCPIDCLGINNTMVGALINTFVERGEGPMVSHRWRHVQNFWFPKNHQNFFLKNFLSFLTFFRNQPQNLTGVSFKSLGKRSRWSYFKNVFSFHKHFLQQVKLSKFWSFLEIIFRETAGSINIAIPRCLPVLYFL